MSKVEKCIENVLKSIVLAFFTAISLFLFVTCIFKTVDVSGIVEVTYNNDSMLINLLVLCLFAGICFAIGTLKGRFNCKVRMGLIANIITMVVSIGLVLWMFFMQYVQTSDQILCLEHARGFLNGDGASWVDGYMSVYPFQSGLVIFDAVLISLFGDFADKAFVIINAIFFIVLVLSICKCCDLIFKEKISSLIQIVLSLFLPFAFYVLLCYGIVIGLALSVLSILCMLQWVHKRKIIYLFLMSLSLATAINFKNNYMIVLVGIVLYLLYDAIKSRNVKSIGGVILIATFYLFANFIVGKTIENRLNVKMSDGIPKIAWVAMGMLEDDNGVPGWFNNYHQYVYNKNDRDSSQTAKECVTYIKARIELLSKQPKKLIHFFYRKISSEWNEPAWESVDVQEVMSYYTPEKFHSFDNGWQAFKKIFNYIQTILNFGLVVYVISCWKRFKECEVYELVFAVMMIGAFMFFAFWEAKSQYAAPYYYIVLPYAVVGWNRLMNKIIENIPFS